MDGANTSAGAVQRDQQIVFCGATSCKLGAQSCTWRAVWQARAVAVSHASQLNWCPHELGHAWHVRADTPMLTPQSPARPFDGSIVTLRVAALYHRASGRRPATHRSRTTRRRRPCGGCSRRMRPSAWRCGAYTLILLHKSASTGPAEFLLHRSYRTALCNATPPASNAQVTSFFPSPCRVVCAADGVLRHDASSCRQRPVLCRRRQPLLCSRPHHSGPGATGGFSEHSTLA